MKMEKERQGDQYTIQVKKKEKKKRIYRMCMQVSS